CFPNNLRRITRDARLQFLQFLRERHPNLIRPSAQNLPELNERRPKLFNCHPDPRLAAKMSERLSVTILQDPFYEIDIKSAEPIRKSILGQEHQNLAPTIDVAINIRDRSDLNTATLGHTRERWPPRPLH